MWKQIFKVTLIAGTFDIIAASIQAYIKNGLTPDIVLKFIASGIFGHDAYSGEFKYMLFGLLVHFFIVFICSSTYFFSYPKFSFLHKSILISSFLIAIAAWVVTTQIIIPLSKIQPSPLNFKRDLTAIAILFFCIGLPIAIITKHFYTKKTTNR